MCARRHTRPAVEVDRPRRDPACPRRVPHQVAPEPARGGLLSSPVSPWVGTVMNAMATLSSPTARAHSSARSTIHAVSAVVGVVELQAHHVQHPQDPHGQVPAVRAPVGVQHGRHRDEEVRPVAAFSQRVASSRHPGGVDTVLEVPVEALEVMGVDDGADASEKGSQLCRAADLQPAVTPAPHGQQDPSVVWPSGHACRQQRMPRLHALGEAQCPVAVAGGEGHHHEVVVTGHVAQRRDRRMAPTPASTPPSRAWEKR